MSGKDKDNLNIASVVIQKNSTQHNSSNIQYDNFVTRAVFIENLKAHRDEAWTDFYDHYARMILNFASKRGCSSSLAEDVLQETVMAVFKNIDKFIYDNKKGRFRSFLFKVTESKIVDAFRKGKRHTNFSDTVIIAKLSKQSIEEYSNKSASIWDQVWEKNILEQAKELAKKRVKPRTFSCFEEVFLKGRKVKAVALEMKISPNLVSQHKHKVLSLVIEEAKQLREKCGE